MIPVQKCSTNTAYAHEWKHFYRNGPQLREVLISLDDDQGSFRGENLTGGNASMASAKKQMQKVSQELVKSLKNRFDGIEEGILEATKIAHLPSWPPSYEEAAGKSLKTINLPGPIMTNLGFSIAFKVPLDDIHMGFWNSFYFN